MTPYERTLSEILVILVRASGGEIIIPGTPGVNPEETVYIYNYDDGYKLQYKNHSTIEYSD